MIDNSDVIAGCEVTGDLLLVRGERILRLDGETGQTETLAPTIDVFLDADLADSSDALGGKLARDRLAGLALGTDPLRLLPAVPFTIAASSPSDFREVPLSQALRAKAKLFETVSELDDGDKATLDFWPTGRTA